MNLTKCPSCGGSVRCESIGWICNKCRGFIDMSGTFYPHEDNPFLPPQTNADHLLAHGVTIREPGEWIVKDSSEESTLCECSKCHVWLTFYEGCYSPNFCPNCGSPMKGIKNG